MNIKGSRVKSPLARRAPSAAEKATAERQKHDELARLAESYIAANAAVRSMSDVNRGRVTSNDDAIIDAMRIVDYETKNKVIALLTEGVTKERDALRKRLQGHE